MLYRIRTTYNKDKYTEIFAKKKIGDTYYYEVEDLNGKSEYCNRSWVLQNSHSFINLTVTKDGKMRVKNTPANTIWNYWTYFQGEQTQGKMTISKVLREYGLEDLQYLKEKGYDSIVIRNAPVGIKEKIIIGREIIVFKPSQIKSIYNLNPQKSDSIFDGFKPKPNVVMPFTPAQLEYFRFTKVRKASGQLKVCYHSTTADFDTFDMSHVGEGGGSSYGNGFYFSTEPIEEYGKVMEVLLDVRKPYEIENINNFSEVLRFLLTCFGE